MNKFKKVVFVGSGKGGVGKSTVSAGIAVSLADKGYKVGLLDADIYGPSQDIVMNLKNGTVHDNEQEDILPTVESYGVRCVSLGSLIKDSQALAWRGPMVVSALRQMVEKTNWGDVEFLVVDLPPGTGDVVMSMAKFVDVDASVIVSTPQDIALLDAKKAYDMFKKINVPVAGMVENMSYHICSSCGSKEHVFGENGLKEFAKQTDSLFLGEIPLNINIRTSCDNGESLAQFAEFKNITNKLLARLDELAELKKQQQEQPVKVVID
jgi:ATP-binding protein involved in chromosome partitioning